MTTKAAEKEQRPFVTDIQELRRRAREHMELGAVTSGYKADRKTVLRILNDVLTTELVCVLRYKRHYYMAAGIHATIGGPGILRARERGAGPCRSGRGSVCPIRRRSDL